VPDVPTRDQESRRRARTWWFAFGGVALVAVAGMMWLGRQSTSDVPPAPKAFCQAAERYEKELARQQEAYEIDVARQIGFVEDIAATAPKAVRADAEVFLESLRAIDAAPDEATRRKLQDDPEVKEAVDNVNRRWNHGCGVFDRQGGI
jgi:hypothetical protein